MRESACRASMISLQICSASDMGHGTGNACFKNYFQRSIFSAIVAIDKEFDPLLLFGYSESMDELSMEALTYATKNQ